ncbi:MAG TPA: MarR family transcriptional regulator [Pirellulales bacterium]|jgi:DNA-binding MarR family transcriptional regulator|nr:MarR family transcriptional regulator [Pirellulales bacterium]
MSSRTSPTPKGSKAKKESRAAVMARLWELGRIMSTQTVFLHQAIAQGVGLNATDTKCLDLILRGPAESVTAGWLSEMTGLTTGAITHIVDRLEKRGFVERLRDPSDRRKVFVRARPEGIQPLVPKYEAVGNAYLKMLRQYNDEELRLICRYLEQTSELSQRELARTIAANRAQGPEKD